MPHKSEKPISRIDQIFFEAETPGDDEIFVTDGVQTDYSIFVDLATELAERVLDGSSDVDILATMRDLYRASLTPTDTVSAIRLGSAISRPYLRAVYNLRAATEVVGSLPIDDEQLTGSLRALYCAAAEVIPPCVVSNIMNGALGDESLVPPLANPLDFS